MSTTTTRTTTFTVSDIRKVVENFAADFSMMAQSTGLRTPENVQKVVSDLRVLAEHGFLIDVTLYLVDAAGNKMQVAKYKVSESASGWKSDRPGDSLWPKTPGGELRVLANITTGWSNMSEAERQQFLRDTGMNYPWPPAEWDTSLSGLNSTAGQKYASNGYGWERTNYTR